MSSSCLDLIQGEPLTTNDGVQSWWSQRQLFSNFLWCWGCTQGPHVGQAGTTWVHRCPSWQLLTFPYLGHKPIPRSYWDTGDSSIQGGGVRSSAMKVTGQVWHRCEPGGHSICQPVPAAAQGWKICPSRGQDKRHWCLPGCDSYNWLWAFLGVSPLSNHLQK